MLGILSRRVDAFGISGSGKLGQQAGQSGAGAGDGESREPGEPVDVDLHAWISKFPFIMSIVVPVMYLRPGLHGAVHGEDELHLAPRHGFGRALQCSWKRLRWRQTRGVRN